MNQKVTYRLRKSKFHILVSKILEYSVQDHKMSLICLQIISKWIKRSPDNFPQLLGHSLCIYMKQMTEKQRDKETFSLALEILMDIFSQNMSVFLIMEGFQLIVEFILNEKYNLERELRAKFIENMVSMLDSENTRFVIRQNFYFGRFFSVFTDSKEAGQEQQKQKERRSGEFIQALLQSDQGLFFLLNNPQYMNSLVDSLRQPQNETQELFRMFLKVFQNKKLEYSYQNVLMIKLLLNCRFYESLLVLAMIDKYEYTCTLIL